MATRRPAPKRKTRNPSSPCSPVRLTNGKRFNAFDGRTVKYKRRSYEIVGCGIGGVATKSAGAIDEGTYALRPLKGGRTIYVPKRVVRDLAFHRGGRAILGMPKKPRAKSATKKAAPRKSKGRSKASYVAGAKKAAATRKRNRTAARRYS